MKHLILTLAAVVVYVTIYGQNSVSNTSPGDINYEDQNYYEIYQQFEEALENDPEAFTESQIKKWERFNYFWGPRLQNDDPDHNGRFSSLISTISDYMSSFVCDESGEGSSWELLGPLSHASNDMGRLDGLYVFPENHNIVMVGAPSSGIWRTTNALDYGNQVWTCVTDDIRFPGLGVVRIERNPFNTDHFIAVTGLATGISAGYGPGPLQSFDKGETWELMESFFFDEFGNLTDPKHTRMTDAKFSPIQDGVIYAITQKQFYRSGNLGETWLVFDDFPELDSGQEAYSLAVSDDGSTLFCSVFSGSDTDGKVLKSIDEGVTWENITSQILGYITPESLTYLPDNEFDNGLSDWEDHALVSLSETWVESIIGDDNGIQDDIQNMPYIYSIYNGPSSGYSSWPLDEDYNWVLRASIPPNSKVSLSLGTIGNSMTEFAFFENTSEESMFIDETYFLEGEIISATLPIPQLNRVYLTCEPLAGNSDPGQIWIGKYAFHAIPEGDPSFYWSNFEVLNNHIYIHGHASDFDFVGASRPIFKSDDNGTTWVSVAPSNTWASRHRPFMRVSKQDENVKYFGDINFYKSNGNNVSPFGEDLHDDIRNIQVIDNNGVDFVAVVTDGGVNTYNGNIWQCLNGTNLAITQFYEIGIHDRLRNTVIGGAQDGNNYKFENGEWTAQYGGDNHAISIIDDERFAVYVNNSVHIRNLDNDVGIKSYNHKMKLPLPIVVNEKANYLYYGAHKTDNNSKPHGLFRVNLLDYETSPPNLLEDVEMSDRHVHRIAVNENEPDVLFCSLSEANWLNSPQFPRKKLLRSTDGGVTWQHLGWAYDDSDPPVLDIFEGVGTISQYREIGAIVSDPYNPNRLWIGFRGFEDGFNGTTVQKVWFTENALADPADIVWQDISAGLPPLSINDLVYQPGTGDLLYAATDVGVFYFDGEEGDDGEWKCFNQDLPVCVVTSIKIHNCEQKLYASTFGRGAWRADLIRKGTQTLSEDLTIDAGETHMFKTNIELEPGVTLTVNGELLMPDDATIRVNPNAKVIINGGRIDNACDGMWRGIEVLGNPNQPQHDIYQGKVVMSNGGSIENATLGVSLGIINENGTADLSTTGGFLICSTDAKFVNCKRAVMAYDYQGTFNNRTKFHNTTFEINDELLDETTPFSQVRLRGVNGVLFQNCTFINSRTDDFPIQDAGSGIIAANANFKVKSCDFENLELGIGVKSFGFDDIQISENTFTGNLGGVSLRYSGLAEVIQNDFNIPAISDLNLGSSHPEVVAFGVYLGGSTGFSVEENTFYSDVIEQNVGVAVHNSGPDPNRIYNNEFGRLGAGIIAMGNNRSANIYHGLLFECNDLGTFDHPLGSSLALTNEGEVRHYQGYLGDDGGAANVFEPVCDPITIQEREFYVGDDTPPLSPVLYFAYSQENTQPNCHTEDMVTIAASQQPLLKNDRCPSNFFSGGSIGDIKENYLANKSIYQGLQLVYNNEYNGGDIEYLRDLIDNPTVSSFDLRNELLLASPRVTSRLLIATIQREPAMNPWHLAQVLLANSRLTQDVINALNQSDVSPYYRELVLDGQYGGISNTTIMESELGHYGGLMEFARIDYVRQLFRQDSTHVWNDSIIHYLGSDASPHLMKTMMSYHIKRNQWQSAQDLLGEASNLRWSSDYVDLVGILIDALSDSTNADDVIANNTTQLLAIATDNSTEAFLAQSILEVFELEEFPEYIELPAPGTKSLFKEKPDNKELIKPIASMHPNPTKDMIYLNWRLPEGMPPQSTNLIIYNGQGVQLLTRSITSEVGIEEFNTTDWPSGLYVYQLLHDNKPIHYGKFEVLR